MTPKREPKDRGLAEIGTGIPGLDIILNGGLSVGGTFIVTGHPGAGKTIFGNQISFHHAKNKGRAVYLTLLAESHGRMMAHLSTLSYFDRSVIENGLTYLSALHVLEEQGLTGLLKFIQQALRKARATLLVIDGLVSASVAAPSVTAFKKFVHELQVINEMAGATALLLTSPGHHQTSDPEHTMVDGVFELTDEIVNMRPTRELEVRKMRGRDFMRGRHTFDIKSTGIVMHPRAETRFALHGAAKAVRKTRAGFGLPELDAMLDGGFVRATTTLILGQAGTGKTNLGLHFLSEGAAKNENALYFGFNEPSPRIVDMATSIGLSYPKWMKQGRLITEWQSSLALGIDELSERLLEKVTDGKIDRLFLDGVEGFRRAAVHPDRLGRYLTALLGELQSRGVTVLITDRESEVALHFVGMPANELPLLIDNYVHLRVVEQQSQMVRLISVNKQITGQHAMGVRTFEITNHGIRVSSNKTFPGSIIDGQSVTQNEHVNHSRH